MGKKIGRKKIYEQAEKNKDTLSLKELYSVSGGISGYSRHSGIAIQNFDNVTDLRRYFRVILYLHYQYYILGQHHANPGIENHRFPDRPLSQQPGIGNYRLTDGAILSTLNEALQVVLDLHYQSYILGRTSRAASRQPGIENHRFPDRPLSQQPGIGNYRLTDRPLSQQPGIENHRFPDRPLSQQPGIENYRLTDRTIHSTLREALNHGPSPAA